jgi:hypothetical protein
MSEYPIGVLFRDTLTAADYDEAIADLQDAKRQAENTSGCSICWDSDHVAAACHFNPLVMARRAIRARDIYRCFHCGFVCVGAPEAEEHFGKSEQEVARCLKQRADALESDRHE